MSIVRAGTFITCVAALTAAAAAAGQDALASGTVSTRDNEAEASPESPAAGKARGKVNDGRSKEPADSARSEGTNGASSTNPGGGVTLKDSSGRAVSMPAGATIAEFLEWRKRRDEAKNGAAEQDFSIDSISFDGEADDERATLTAVLSITINRDDGWVLVPVGMAEAVLDESADHSGAGDAGFDRRDAKEGYRWWLRGKGEHKLKLSLIVPVRKSIPQRRLRLSIPRAAASSLKLQVPMPRVKVSAPENSWHQTRSAAKDATEIEVVGLGTGFDMSWQPVPVARQVETVLESVTEMDVSFTPESVILEAVQTIQVQGGQGTVHEAAVHLPAGFDLLDVHDREGGHYARHERDPADPTRWIVEFKLATSGPVRLEWTLEAPFPKKGGAVVVSGFEIDNARRQTGRIAVYNSVDGFRVSKRRGEDRFVFRTGVENGMTPPGDGRAVSAYRFLKQPFRLVLETTEIEPYFSAGTDVHLRLSDRRIELDAVVRVEVVPERGALEELVLKWPGWHEGGWTIDPVRSPGLVDERAGSPFDPETGSARLQFVTRQTGAFDIPVRAVLDVPEGGEPFVLTLPSVASPSRSASTLIVDPADNVEYTLEPAEGTRTTPAGAEQRHSLEIPDDFRGDVLQLNSMQRRFWATVVKHAQLIEAASEAVVQRVGVDSIAVRQRLSYNVQYERVRELKLIAPDELLDSLQIVDEDGLQLQWTPDTVKKGPRLVTVLLPAERLGPFQISADFETPINGGEVQEIRVLEPADGRLTSTAAAFAEGLSDRLSVESTDWKPWINDEGARGFKSETPEIAIPLSIRDADGSSTGELVATKAVVRTAVDADGGTRGRAQFLLSGVVRQIRLSFPAGLEPEAFWLNDDRLDDDRVAANPAGGYTIQASNEAASGEHLLTVDYRSRSLPENGILHRHQLACPRLEGGVWVRQTIWKVATTSVDDHLFAAPADFTRQYEWVRQNVMWIRRPVPQIEAAMSFEPPGPPARSDLLGQNVYPFSRFGPADELALSTMSRPWFVFLGAGLALAGGFLLIKVSVSRNPLTALLVIFAAATASIWYAEPIRLLLQPALLGLALAIAAAMIESALKHEAAPSDTELDLELEPGVIVPTGLTAEVPADVTGSEAYVEYQAPGGSSASSAAPSFPPWQFDHADDSSPRRSPADDASSGSSMAASVTADSAS